MKNEKEFSKHINEGNLFPIYYIKGNNSWLKQNSLDQIINKLEKEKSNIEIYKFSGKNIDLSNFINLCESIPLGYSYKCLVVKDWELDKLSSNELKILSKLFSNISNFCNIIIANINVCVSDIKIKTIIESIKNYGLIVEFSSPSPAEIINFIISISKENNCYISNENARMLSDYCNKDLTKISCELEKLTSFCQSKEITQTDIELLVVPSIEIKIFDMIKFINNKNYNKTFEILNNLLSMKEEPVIILSIISMNFLDIYRAKVAKQDQKNPSDIINLFDYKGKDFRVSKAFLESNQYTLPQIRNIINLLIKSDYKLKTSPVDKKIILQELLVKIFNTIGA